MRILQSVFAAIVLISLTTGCGLKGPLKKPEPATSVKPPATQIEQPAAPEK